MPEDEAPAWLQDPMHLNQEVGPPRQALERVVAHGGIDGVVLEREPAVQIGDHLGHAVVTGELRREVHAG